MSDNNDDEKLDRLLKKLEDTSVFNGGFDNLRESVNDVKESQTKMLYELSEVKKAQSQNTKKINELHKALYDPDDGLYTKVRETRKDTKNHEEAIEEVKSKTDNLTEKVSEISNQNTTLQSVAGEDLKDLRDTIRVKNKLSKLFWVVLAAALSIIARVAWTIFTGT